MNNIHDSLKHLQESMQTGGSDKTHSERFEQAKQWQSQQALKKQFEYSGIFKRFWHADFSNFEVAHSPELQRNLKIVEEYADYLIKGYSSNLVLSGLVGNGKTHLGVAVMKKLIVSGKTAYYTTLFDALSSLKNFKSDIEAFRSHLRKVDLLVMDEVNSNIMNLSETDKNLIFEIFNTRYKDKKPTLVITNIKPSDLEMALGVQVLSRLYEDGRNELVFTQKDYRLNKNKQK